MALCAMTLVGCENAKKHQEKTQESPKETNLPASNLNPEVAALVDSLNQVANTGKWVAYRQPVMDYNIVVFVSDEEKEDYKHSSVMLLEKDGEIVALRYDINFMNYYSMDFGLLGDTLWVDNMHQDVDVPYFDYDEFAFFDDFNFDGVKELCICGSPHQYRSESISDFLDTEPMIIFQHTEDGFVQMTGTPYDDLAQGRMYQAIYDIDTENQTMKFIMTWSMNTSTADTYFFQDGRCVKLERTTTDLNRKPQDVTTVTEF